MAVRFLDMIVSGGIAYQPFRLQIIAKRPQETAEERHFFVVQTLCGVAHEFIDFLPDGLQHVGGVLCQHDAFGTSVLRILLAFDEIEGLQLVEIGADGHRLDAETGGNIRLFAAINDGYRQQCACFTGGQA